MLRDGEVIGRHVEDAAHYPGGHATGVAYPRSEADIARLVRAARRVLPVGAQSSLTGGATPFGEVVLSTARLDRITSAGSTQVTVGAGVTLEGIVAALQPYGAAYPPIPTFTGATAGGAVATNAAGAATFKYGSTRDWVQSLSVVLASGEVLDLVRGEHLAGPDGFTIECAAGRLHVPLPTYRMPRVAKRSAGYHAEPNLDLIDLFIGSEGTLGIVSEISFRTLSPAPVTALALICCPSEEAGIRLVSELRRASEQTRQDRDPRGIDACAIEHVDDRSLELVCEAGDLAALDVSVPDPTRLVLLVQLELPAGTTAGAAYARIANALSTTAEECGLTRLVRLLHRFELLDRTELAAPGDVRRQQQLLRFRESVPARVNHLVGMAKRTGDSRIEKVAGDMVVPFDRFGEMLEIYRRGFIEKGLRFAIWGHISDGNVHPNVIPRSFQDVERGKQAILEFGREVVRLGGCPLGEHGVGRNPVKQALLRQLYGDAAIDQMRAVKRALDPSGTLAPGVIFPA